MVDPVPTPLVGYQVRHWREATHNQTPAGNGTVIPFKSFDPSGGDVTRQKAGNTVGDGQVVANIATDVVIPSATATSDILHNHYTPLWEEVVCSAVAAASVVTGTNIAIVAGNILRLTSGTWPFVVGDRVVVVAPWISNAAIFISRVTANVTTDLTLDTAYGTLTAEAAGPSASVGYAGRFRLGNSLLTGTYEMFNSQGSTGEVLRGLSAFGVTAKFTHPGAPDLSWQFKGPHTVAITSALANATTAAAAQYPFDSNEGFGAQLLTNGGGGLFYSGALYPNVRVQELNVAITRPRQVSGAAGVLGPQVVFVDDVFDIKVQLKICNDHADARALLTDSRASTTLASLGWAWRDPNGGLEYWYFGALDPSKGKRSPLQQTGEDMFDFEWMARRHATHSMFERTLLN